ncbi:MAG: DUF2971 domain-containing protein [Campylobacter sp.]|nr:DUF2971 domain-containing protein [Campylobacter sp.]
MCENENCGKYYKYRALGSPKDFKHCMDILKDNKLYAGKFDKFNDPFEGLYIITSDKVDAVKNYNAKIWENGYKNNICCFSLKDEIDIYSDALMWSHYANSSRGIRIEFDLDPSFEADEVKYLDFGDFPTINSDEEFARKFKKIMTTKHKAWKYERENRVLTDKQFVKIEIKNITFGRGLFDMKSRIYQKGLKFDCNFIKEILEIYDAAVSKEIDIYYYSNFYETESSKLDDNIMSKLVMSRT